MIFISRTLSKSELNYSNIEREALAIVWAVVRLKQFLLGRSFRIVTDHKPLEYLFKPKSPIPSGTSARIFRWAIELMHFDYAIQYIPGKEIPHADALSRMRYNNEEQSHEDNMVTKSINAIQFENKALDARKVQFEIANDPFMYRIMNRVKTGNWTKCSQAEKPFRMNSSKLTIQDNMLYHGLRLYIPIQLRKEAFQNNHDDNHSGIQSSINRMKLSVWWPGMETDIQRMVSKCPVCQKVRPQSGKTIEQWPNVGPFERLHTDWAYVKGVGEILIIVDASTGWIEAYPTKDRESSTVIRCLRTVFTRFGIPHVLVSDNATEFISNELNQWLSNQGIRKLESPIYFPRSNGIAERAVQTIKSGLKAWSENQTHQEFNAFLQKILFHHRISSFSRGQSPAELVFGRKIRIPVVAPYEQGEKIWFKAHNKANPQNSTYLMTRGRNTSWILNNDKLIMASNNQLAIKSEPIVEEEEEEIAKTQNTEVIKKNPRLTNEVTVGRQRSTRNCIPPKRFGFEED